MDKIKNFFSNHACVIVEQCSEQCRKDLISDLSYTETELCNIELATRGQASNKVWHAARFGLLTASNFKLICHSTNGSKTAASLLEGSSLNDSCLPAPVAYGRKNEENARQLFMKSHRYHHRACSLLVPGLTICQTSQFLGCSADAIVTCKTCGKFIVEIKCLWSQKNFHPTVGAVLTGVCCKNANDELVLKPDHKYYYQIQGQMAITGVTKAFLVLFTNKGIASVPVAYDAQFWESCLERLTLFYMQHMYYAFMRKFTDKIVNVA